MFISPTFSVKVQSMRIFSGSHGSSVSIYFTFNSSFFGNGKYKWTTILIQYTFPTPTKTGCIPWPHHMNKNCWSSYISFGHLLHPHTQPAFFFAPLDSILSTSVRKNLLIKINKNGHTHRVSFNSHDSFGATYFSNCY